MICTVRFEFEAENFFQVPFRESVHFTLIIRITSPGMERKPEWDPKAIEKLSERDKLVSFFIKFPYNQLYNLASHKIFTVHYTCSLAGISQDQEGIRALSALDWAQRQWAGLPHLPSQRLHILLTVSLLLTLVNSISCLLKPRFDSWAGAGQKTFKCCRKEGAAHYTGKSCGCSLSLQEGRFLSCTQL